MKNIIFIYIIAQVLLLIFLLYNGNFIYLVIGGVILIVFSFIKYFNIDGKLLYYCEDSQIDHGFKASVRNILANSNWHKYRDFEETDDKSIADVIIKLTARDELDIYHKTPKYRADGTLIRFSITTYGKRPYICYIDSENWLYGVPQSKLSLEDYRKYVINHEFGHGLDYGHQKCTSGLCPVMYQATRGAPDNAQCGCDVQYIDTTEPIG